MWKTHHNSFFSPSPVLLRRQHHSQVVSNLQVETLSSVAQDIIQQKSSFCDTVYVSFSPLISSKNCFAKLYILPEPDLEKVPPSYQPGSSK